MSLFSFLESLWQGVVIRLAGKRIAILGARATGKTRLINFLQTKTVPLPGKEFPTSIEKVPGTVLDIGGISITLAPTEDVSGHESHYDEWKAIASGSAFIIYLFRADLLNENDSHVKQRIKDDLTIIRTWSQSRIVLVGTHTDKDKEFLRLSQAYDEQYRIYTDILTENDVIAEAISTAGGPAQCKVVSGSLMDANSTAVLVTETFKVIDKWLG
jgi:hypothetical protein